MTEPAADDPFGEVREAAGALIASLKQFIEATERVVEDPEAFAGLVEGGRTVVDAFLGGLTGRDEAEPGPEPAADAESNAHGGGSGRES